MIQKSDLSRITIRITVASTGRRENVSLSELSDSEFSAWVWKVWPEMLSIVGRSWDTATRVQFCNALELRYGRPLHQDGRIEADV